MGTTHEEGSGEDSLVEGRRPSWIQDEHAMAEIPGFQAQNCNVRRWQCFCGWAGSDEKGWVESAGPSVSPLPYIQWYHPHVREDGLQECLAHPYPSLFTYIHAAQFTSSTPVRASGARTACYKLHGDVPSNRGRRPSQSRLQCPSFLNGLFLFQSCNTWYRTDRIRRFPQNIPDVMQALCIVVWPLFPF